MKVVLKMDSTEIGIVFFVVLVMGIPGSKLGGYLSISLEIQSPAPNLRRLFHCNDCSHVAQLMGPEDRYMTFILGRCGARSRVATPRAYYSLYLHHSNRTGG
jgi:hypothetical protein